jgi:nucleotide-binding universal stress UspA family protein
MRVLLAIDDSAYSEAAVKVVMAQLRPANTEVCVFHAVEWLREMPRSYMFGEGPTYDKDILASRERSFKKAKELVARVAEQLQAAGFHTTTATPDSDPRHGIIDCAADWKADLIVMGSHGRRGLDKWLLGSVAEAVMRHASCSVEIVRLSSSAISLPARSGAPEESPISSTAR